VLRLDDRWAWDFWIADTGSDYHLFFLNAPRSLGDPNLRHHSAVVGHAVSSDLVHWKELDHALEPGPEGAWDDVAIWTGSVIRGDDAWYMFYTGSSTREGALIQRIGLATSPDLMTWTKHAANPIIEADPAWYEQLDTTAWHDQAWRDPWVFADPDGDGYHALITARASTGPVDARGVVAHARSQDLVHWVVRPPISVPGEFGQLEVQQVEVVDGRPILVFSVGATEVGLKRRALHPDLPSGTYICPGVSLLGPFDLEHDARLVSDLYSGRLVRRRDGGWVLLGFVNLAANGSFVGAISDPVPFELLHS
jgi:beta-fructofuranosidase